MHCNSILVISLLETMPEIWELNKIGTALGSVEKIAILEILYKNGDCTFHEICSSIGLDKNLARNHLITLEDVLLINSKEQLTHPLTKEKVYHLSGRGKRYWGALKQAVLQENLILDKHIKEPYKINRVRAGLG